MPERTPKEIEDAMIAAYLNGASAKEAAALFGYDKRTCLNALKRRGLKPRTPLETMFLSSYARYIPKEHEDAMIAAYLAGASARQAAESLGYEEAHCFRVLQNRGITRRSSAETQRIPSKHEDAIIAAYLAGATAKEAAAQFGYSRQTAENVLKRRGIPIRPFTESHRHYSLDERFFDRIDTPDKAYWLGFLTADGVIGDRFVRIHLQLDDAEHLSKFAASLRSEQPVSFRENTSSNGTSARQAMIIINSIKLAQSLHRLGVTSRKTFIVRPCEEVPETLLADYWRGVFDGDGSISRSGLLHLKWQVSLVGNKAMVEGFREFIARFVRSNASVRPM